MAFMRSPVRSRSGPPSFARLSGELRMASQASSCHAKDAHHSAKREGGPHAVFARLSGELGCQATQASVGKPRKLRSASQASSCHAKDASHARKPFDGARRLPPSLKLWRTAEALAKAVSRAAR
jgi:hypothetical protein